MSDIYDFIKTAQKIQQIVQPLRPENKVSGTIKFV